MNCPYCQEHMTIKKYQDLGKEKIYWFDCEKGCRRKWEVREIGKSERKPSEE